MGLSEIERCEAGIVVPASFVLTKDAYQAFVDENGLYKKIKQLLGELGPGERRTVERVGAKIRALFMRGKMPSVVAESLLAEFRILQKSGRDVLVRSSVVGDVVDNTLAGLFGVSAPVRTETALTTAVKQCFASLFSDAALQVYVAKSIDPRTLAMAVLVQAYVVPVVVGTLTTLEQATGFRGMSVVSAHAVGRQAVNSYDLATASVVRGRKAILRRTIGDVNFSMADDTLMQLVRWGAKLEVVFGGPVRVDFVQDAAGKVHVIEIVPLVFRAKPVHEMYKLSKAGTMLAHGQAIGHQVVQGGIRIFKSLKDVNHFQAGDVIVARTLDVSFDRWVREAAAVIVEDTILESYVVRTCRELDIPCIIGAKKARQELKDGQIVTVSCADGDVGAVYRGRLPFTVEPLVVKTDERTKTKVLVHAHRADRTVQLADMPTNGVGLLAEESLYEQAVGIHPLALTSFKNLKDKKVKVEIEARTVGYTNKESFAVDRLAEAVGRVAVAFEGREVVFRLSAADSTEYAALVGGKLFERVEKNPLLGWRGVSRYVDERFSPAFALTLAAIKRVRDEWGLMNVTIMVPFCRTLEEAKTLFAILKAHGLERGRNGFKVFVVCEIPANVILAKELAKLFDGFCISLSNLSQLTFGVDRSVFSASRYIEDEVAIKQLIKDVIRVARSAKRMVTIADSSAVAYQPFLTFLVQEGIMGIAVTPDKLLALREKLLVVEKKLGAEPLSLPRSIFSKAVSLAGLSGMSLMLAGYTCKTVSDQDIQAQVQTQIQTAVADQIATVRHEVRVAVLKEEKEKYAKDLRSYTEKSFVHFKLSYPAQWQIEHDTNTISFFDPAVPVETWFFTVSSKPFVLGNRIINEATRVTTTWSGIAARRYSIFGGEGTTPVVVLEVYPDGFKKSKTTMYLYGDVENFDTILTSIADFKVLSKE